MAAPSDAAASEVTALDDESSWPSLGVEEATQPASAPAAASAEPADSASFENGTVPGHEEDKVVRFPVYWCCEGCCTVYDNIKTNPRDLDIRSSQSAYQGQDRRSASLHVSPVNDDAVVDETIGATSLKTCQACKSFHASRVCATAEL